MDKHYHNQQANQKSHPLCSCGIRQCLVPQLLKEILEVVDNLFVLQSEGQHLEATRSYLSAVLSDRNAHLWEWERAFEDYQSQMNAHFALRPTAGSQAKGTENFAGWRKADLSWFHQEDRELGARLRENQNALARLMSRLSELQLAFTKQPLSSACQPRVLEILDKHLQLLIWRIKVMQRKVEEIRDQQGELHHLYQQEQARIAQACSTHQQGEMLGLSSINSRWLMYALFGIGQPKSLSASRGAYNQVMLTQRYQQTCAEQSNFLWYSREAFSSLKRLPTQAMVETLQRQFSCWQAQIRNLRNGSSEPQIVITLLEEAKTFTHTPNRAVVVTPLTDQQGRAFMKLPPSN